VVLQEGAIVIEAVLVGVLTQLAWFGLQELLRRLAPTAAA
jgi:hypothetical protein